MTNTQLKTQIDTDITNKLISKSISPLNVGKNLKDIVDYTDQVVNYKSYIGQFNQSSTDLPVVTEIFNNIFTEITWTRSSAGNYTGTITGGEFVAGKTFIPNRRWCVFTSTSSSRNVYLQAHNQTFIVNTNDGTDGIDGVWFDFEIRVYN